MRENRPYGLEGGESGSTGLPYPYRTVDPNCLLPSRCEAVVGAARTKNQFRCVFLVADSVAT
jgi:hypothetical protein